MDVMAMDFQMIIPILAKGRSIIGVGSNDISVSDVRALNKRLREIDPNLKKLMVREAKTIGRIAESKIKSAIPVTTPLRATNSVGRMSWDHQISSKGGLVAANKTMVQFRTSASGRSATTSLVAVKVLAPMTVVADMAGRSGRQMNKGYKNSGYTREFLRNGVPVRMKLNGQGDGMLKKLGPGGSRYAWPALIEDKPQLEAQLRLILKKYEAIANRGFN
jgi:hypothetical protein